MEKSYDIRGDDFVEILKMLIFSSIGVVLFFFPLVVDRDIISPVLYMSELIYLKNKKFVYIFVSLTIVLFIVKNLFKREKTISVKLDTAVKIISVFILIILTINNEIILFSDKNLEQLVREEIFRLTFVLPVAAIFLPFVLEYGLINILDGCLGRRFKGIFNTSGKNLLIILVFLFVDKYLGFYVVYKLYREGRLRNNECINALLNYPILSFSINLYIANKLNINKLTFTLSYLIIFTIANFIISRIYPISKLKKSFCEKNRYKERYYRKNKLKMSTVNYLENRRKRSLLKNCLAYFNEGVNIVSNMLPAILFSFLILDFLSRVELFTVIFTSIYTLILQLIKIPNANEVANAAAKAFFNPIYAVESLNTYALDFTTRIIISIIAVCQGIYFTGNLVFIALYTRFISIKHIIIVYLEKIIIISLTIAIFYYCRLGISLRL